MYKRELVFSDYRTVSVMSAFGKQSQTKQHICRQKTKLYQVIPGIVKFVLLVIICILNDKAP